VLTYSYTLRVFREFFTPPYLKTEGFLTANIVRRELLKKGIEYFSKSGYVVALEF
jgi:hypothetical protein